MSRPAPCSAESGVGNPRAASLDHCLEHLELAPAMLSSGDATAKVEATRGIGMRSRHDRDAPGVADAVADHDLLEEAAHAP